MATTTMCLRLGGSHEFSPNTHSRTHTPPVSRLILKLLRQSISIETAPSLRQVLMMDFGERQLWHPFSTISLLRTYFITSIVGSGIQCQDSA